jgi:hypothetical protein
MSNSVSYTRINNAVFDKNLSFGAIGLLCSLLAKNENEFDFEIPDDSNELKELIVAGFVAVTGDLIVVSDRVIG